MAKAKGVAHAGKRIGMSTGEADENERQKNDKNRKGEKVSWDEKTYRDKNKKPFNNYDWSRARLNFEITKGADGKPKIIPLGSQDMTLYKRYQKVLEDVDFKQYKLGASNQQLTYVGLILSGSTEKMQKIAFGDQNVDYERNPEQWKNWNVNRTKAIEEWAVDTYNFVCDKYGEENIVGFEVHLDETEPHVHCNIVPTAVMQQRGAVGGYIKIDADGNDVRYTKGKHVGELVKINKAKYDRLSDEKKKEYRPNVRGTVRTISYAAHFGSTKTERSQKMSQLHTDFYEKVGKKWGFERGDVWADLSEEERRRRRRRTKEQAYEEKEAEKAKQEAIKGRDTAVEEKEAAMKEAAEQQAVINRNKATIVNQDDLIRKGIERIEQQNADLKAIQSEKQKAVSEKDDAVRQRNAAVRTLEESKSEVKRNERTIESQATTIGKNKNVIDEQEKTKAALQKHIDLMGRIENLTYQEVSSYVQDLEGVDIILNNELRKKLISPLKDHPRILYTNPPLTARELERIALDEETKVINRIGGFTGISKNKAYEEIRNIRTDVQTILFDIVGAKQKRGIQNANREIYKGVKQELAEVYKKAEQFDRMKKAGITESSFEEMKQSAEKGQKAATQLSETEDMLEFAWPGVTKAKNILTDPALDKNYMTDEQKNNVVGVLRDNPKHPEYRLDDIMRLLKYACSFRDIPVTTRGEAIESAASNIIKSIADSGYDLVKEASALVGSVAKDLEMTVAEAAESTASAAVCLIFGYLDAATTVSEGCGGGGGNNDLPKKKDDEDLKSFYGRCLGTAVRMMRPSRQMKVGR